MLQTEYVRNLHCNYERLLLDQTPEEKRYQYCILSRGGIKGLLPCSLRYINGLAYLYYDISSKQSIVQLFGSKSITRDWLRDFMWSFRQIRQELDRFLLDGHNIIWYPEQVFQDLDSRFFSFMYVPYHERDNGLLELVDFWVEHIDYEDETLVEFVYHIHDQLEKSGEAYLQGQIFKDADVLEQRPLATSDESVSQLSQQRSPVESEHLPAPKEEKKRIFGIFEGKKRKNKEARENYHQTMQEAMRGRAVADEPRYGYSEVIREHPEAEYEYREKVKRYQAAEYRNGEPMRGRQGLEYDYEEEEYGKTVYIEERIDPAAIIHYLYSPEGKLLASLETSSLSIGKKKGEVDLVLNDLSVSRLHARIVKEGSEIYLEDLNSTNGTFKNGLRLEPYERRKLETEDEIKCGNVTLVFR